jgi:template-activating factor I
MIQASTIDWKDNLCEKYPRKKVQDNSEEYDGDQGSFFHYFTEASDPWSVSCPSFELCSSEEKLTP